MGSWNPLIPTFNDRWVILTATVVLVAVAAVVAVAAMGAAAVAGATPGSLLEAIAAVATLLQVAEVEAGAVTLFSPFPPNSWFNSRATESLAQNLPLLD